MKREEAPSGASSCLVVARSEGGGLRRRASDDDLLTRAGDDRPTVRLESDFTLEDLQREVLGRGLSALLLSNPCNPMGKLVSGEELADWVGVGRQLDCTCLNLRVAVRAEQYALRGFPPHFGDRPRDAALGKAK